MLKEERMGKEERIRHVLETAKSLFIRQGFSATTTSQIAREAGIVEMTLFRYFPTKKHLFEEVISPLTGFDWFPKDRVRTDGMPKDLVISLLHNRAEFAKRERDLVRLVIIESKYQPDFNDEFNPLAKSSKQLRELLMELGINEQNSYIIVNLIMGLILTIAFTPKYDEQIIDQTIQYIETQITQLLALDVEAPAPLQLVDLKKEAGID